MVSQGIVVDIKETKFSLNNVSTSTGDLVMRLVLFCWEKEKAVETQLQAWAALLLTTEIRIICMKCRNGKL